MRGNANTPAVAATLSLKRRSRPLVMARSPIPVMAEPNLPVMIQLKFSAMARPLIPVMARLDRAICHRTAMIEMARSNRAMTCFLMEFRS
jgi:hypothetical protein